MEQNTTETKLKLEGEILILKREFKYASENLARVTTDTQDVINTKDRVTKEIDERNKELTKVLNDISSEKLTWALEKQAQMEKIEEKEKKADEILKKEAGFVEKEVTIKKIEEKNTDVLNETRRLELKVADDMLLVKNKEKEVEASKKEIENDRKELEKKQGAFKERVLKVLKEADNL